MRWHTGAPPSRQKLAAVIGRPHREVEEALWELSATGMVTGDGFDNLRALVDPARRRATGIARFRRTRRGAGRWALLSSPGVASGPDDERPEAFARQLLRRWGVVFKDVVAREGLLPPWRGVLQALRRMEARGEVRGGRFVAGYLGEQFAEPDAVDALRAARRLGEPEGALRVAAADPLEPGWDLDARSPRQPAVGPGGRRAGRRGACRSGAMRAKLELRPHARGLRRHEVHRHPHRHLDRGAIQVRRGEFPFPDGVCRRSLQVRVWRRDAPSPRGPCRRCRSARPT